MPLRMVLVCFMALVLLSVLPAFAEPQQPTSGTITGILTAKGESWIEVQAEGAKAAERYLPFWRGGLPKDGGSFDKEMLKTIKSLRVTNLVKLAWTLEEHKRIVSVEMILPAEKSGTLTGQVVATGINPISSWIDIQPVKDGKPDTTQPVERYMPRWVGGAPKDGGSFDKAVVSAIAALKPGTIIQLKWTYDERKRVVEITPLASDK